MLVSNRDSPPSPKRTKRLPPFSMYCFSASNYTKNKLLQQRQQKTFTGEVGYFLLPHFMSIYQNVHSYSWHSWDDYQLSKARQVLCRTFIVLLSQATYFVSIGNNINSRANALPAVSCTILWSLLQMMSKTEKSPLEMEPVARDMNTIFTVKPGDQNFCHALLNW